MRVQALIYAHVNDMGNDMEVCYRHDSMALYAGELFNFFLAVATLVAAPTRY